MMLIVLSVAVFGGAMFWAGAVWQNIRWEAADAEAARRAIAGFKVQDRETEKVEANFRAGIFRSYN